MNKTQILKYRWVYAMLDEHRDMFAEREKKFLNEINEINEINKPPVKPPPPCEPPPVEPVEPSEPPPPPVEPVEPSEPPPPPVEPSEPPPPVDPFLTMLYRKLSLLTHPDKSGGSSERFGKVKQLFDTKNTMGLWIMSQDLGLSIPLPDTIDLDTGNLQREIDKYTSSIPWIWADATPQQRLQIKVQLIIKKCTL
jgi:hypothetical protein